MTPDSSANSYLSPADFLLRRDYRSVGQYLADDPLMVSTDPAVIEASPILMALLMSASGTLEAACLRGGRYSPADLASLTGNSGEYLKQVVADITMYYVMTRRPGPNPPQTVVDSYNQAMDTLNALSSGTMIFGFAETVSAGLPLTYQMVPPNIFRNNMITSQYPRAFGIRQNLRRPW